MQEVIDIRERAARGEKQADIARLHGVTPACVWQIVSGRSFKNAPGPIARPSKDAEAPTPVAAQTNTEVAQ